MHVNAQLTKSINNVFNRTADRTEAIAFQNNIFIQEKMWIFSCNKAQFKIEDLAKAILKIILPVMAITAIAARRQNQLQPKLPNNT